MHSDKGNHTELRKACDQIFASYQSSTFRLELLKMIQVGILELKNVANKMKTSLESLPGAEQLGKSINTKTSQLRPPYLKNRKKMKEW